MVSLDLAELSVREANTRLRMLGEAGEDVDILNPDARHHIGVGLTAPVRVNVRGSAGYFCAGLTDQAHFDSRQHGLARRSGHESRYFMLRG